MTMTPRVLTLLVRLATNRRDARAQDAQQAESNRRQALLTAQALAQFEAEQFAHRRQQGGQSQSVAQIQGQQGFHRKLSQARALQDDVCKRADQAADSARETLLAEQRRLQALQSLVTIREQERRRAALRAEQTNLDEHSLRALIQQSKR